MFVELILGEITFKIFQRILNEEKGINERTLEEAFEAFYNKDGKHDWSAVDYNRFRTDMLEVDLEFLLTKLWKILF
jgi:hypothetical protein